MSSKILFAPVRFERYDKTQTLPSRFERLLDETGLEGKVKGKLVAIKMHVGRGIGFTTVHPLFVKALVDKLKSWGAKVYVTDQEIADARLRGYTEELLGCPILEVCGFTGKYVYYKDADFKRLQNVDVAGFIHDCDFLIDLSHIKGHGSCGYGGACKNIAMGCVTDRTRQQIHGLEGGLVWDEAKCTHCKQCIDGCNHYANTFDKDGKYEVNYHHCTLCQHCVKVCPTGAISLDSHNYTDFQTGMAIATKTVLDCIGLENVYYINVLTNITAVCDCWGFTTPSLVPDIGIMASDNMVAIDRAAIDAIKVENLLPDSFPSGHTMSGSGHLFEQLHGKNPYIQLDELEKVGMGSQEYELIEVL